MPGQIEAWVTHQVNVTALTGEGVAIGEVLVLRGGCAKAIVLQRLSVAVQAAASAATCCGTGVRAEAGRCASGSGRRAATAVTAFDLGCLVASTTATRRPAAQAISCKKSNATHNHPPRMRGRK